jgi:hypothetical protein
VTGTPRASRLLSHGAKRTTRQKLVEWVRRYLPCEIAGTVGELGGAAAAYLLTGSMAAAAIAATIGASVGYYAAAYLSAVRWVYREQSHLRWAARVLVANVLALRSVTIEPVMFDNVAVGWIFGKLLSDIGFYVLAIFSYERFKGLLAVRRPHSEEADGESVPAVATA